jgi:GntR family transcriptional regulator, transcriptional repressor for pyruvate dehydrogenase complex
MVMLPMADGVPPRETTEAEAPRMRRSVKSAELVALEIVREIVSRHLRAGDRLPPESEMVTQFGFSRPTIREALRLLEFQGLISIRPGPGAGTVVGRAQSEKLAQTLTLYLHLAESTYQELLEAWADAEGVMAWRAARNPDRELARKLMEPYIEGGACCVDDLRLRQVGRRFHTDVERLAANRVESLAFRSIAAITAQHVMNNIPGEMLDDWVHDHTEVAKAIIEGDAETARNLMHAHIEHIDRHFQRLWPEKVGQRLKWGATQNPF